MKSCRSALLRANLCMESKKHYRKRSVPLETGMLEHCSNLDEVKIPYEFLADPDVFEDYRENKKDLTHLGEK